MSKKLTILVCLMAIFGLKLSAQEDMHFGVFLGGSINMMKIDNSYFYDDSEPITTMSINPSTTDTTYSASYLAINGASVKPNGGFILGGYFEYKASKLFGLQFELFYNQYGATIKGTVDKKNLTDNNYITYDYNSSLKISNFSAAVLVKFYTLHDHLTIDLGAQPSYCFRMTKEGKRGIEQISTAYNDKDYNSLNLSATGGLTGYLGDFFLSARYSIGFIDVLNSKQPFILNDDPTNIKYDYSEIKSTTSSVQLTVGYRIK